MREKPSGTRPQYVQCQSAVLTIFRSVIAPKSAITLRPLGSSTICASHEAYIIDPDSTEKQPSFAASTNSVRSIVTSTSKVSGPITFLTAAKYDHFINVFRVGSEISIGLLRTENEVISMALHSELQSNERILVNGNASSQSLHPEEVLATVTKDGILEIFPEPFVFGEPSNLKEPESKKSRMMQRTKKAAAQIRMTRPEKSATALPLIDAEFDENYLSLAWVEGGVNPIFSREQWRNEVTGSLLFTGTKEIVKARSGIGVGAVVMNGVKDMGKSHVDESRTVVANSGEVEDLPATSGEREIIDISSGVEESDFDEEMLPVPVTPPIKSVDGDVEMEDAVPVGDKDAVAGGQESQRIEEAEEPSFGDIIKANAPEPVNVRATYEDPSAQTLAPVGERQPSLPSGMTLSTVLTQSLRTNDLNLLETCFHERNLQTVRATIERLDSSLAAILVENLAERLYSRPGRAGGMMVWIQWTAVAHGGYIAGQPDVMKKLADLRRVVDDRANSLQPLLKLKGKLDMLEAQMNLRKSMQARSMVANTIDEDDEEGVIYVEGQEESDSGNEAAPKSSIPLKPKGRHAEPQDNDNSDQSESEDEDEDEDDMPPVTNGIIDESEDESSGSEDVGFLDDEASSTDEDSGDEASEDGVNHDDIDSDGSEISSDPEEVPSAKRPRKEKLSNGLGVKRR